MDESGVIGFREAMERGADFQMDFVSPYFQIMRLGLLNRDGEAGNLKVLTKPAVPSSVKAKRTSKVSTKTTAELSFKKVDRASTYRIYKYDKKTKKYTMAFRVVNNKLYQYNSKTKKYAKVNNVKVKGGVITCSLKNLNLKSEKSQKYIVRSTVSKTGYTTQYSANSKSVTIK